MSQRADALLQEALALPATERADVAAELLASLDSPSPEDQAAAQAAWTQEIERRARQVLELPREQRAQVAEDVLLSLEEPSEDVAQAWVETLERRSNDVASGQVQPVEWEVARAEVTRELERRRAGRTSS